MGSQKELMPLMKVTVTSLTPDFGLWHHSLNSAPPPKLTSPLSQPPPLGANERCYPKGGPWPWKHKYKVTQHQDSKWISQSTRALLPQDKNSDPRTVEIMGPPPLIIAESGVQRA